MISALHFPHFSRNSFFGNGPKLSQLISPFSWIVKQHGGGPSDLFSVSLMIRSSEITLSNLFLRLVTLIPSEKYVENKNKAIITKHDTLPKATHHVRAVRSQDRCSSLFSLRP